MVTKIQLATMDSKLSSVDSSNKDIEQNAEASKLEDENENNEDKLKWMILSFKELLLLILYFVVGCVFYCNYEGWTIKGALFFTVVTISTVGYGYSHPTDDNSRLFTMFYLVIGVYFIFYWISSVILERAKHATKLIEKNRSMEIIGVEMSDNRRMMIWNILGIVLVILVGGCINMGLENWTFIQGLYFALQTATTVGYGDMTITNEATNAFTSIFILFSTVLFAFAVNNFQTLKAQEAQLNKLKEMNLKRKDLRFLEELDTGDGISKEQFALALLVHLGTVDADKDVKPWFQKFDELNPDTDGKIRRETLHEFSQRESMFAEQSLNLGRMSESIVNPLSLFYSQNRILGALGTSVDFTTRPSTTIQDQQRTMSQASNRSFNSNSFRPN